MAINSSSYQFYYFLSSIVLLIRAWAPDITPKLINLQIEKSPSFFGNTSDYFKLLDQDDNTILIGARNAVYNLSINGLLENNNERIEWISSDADRELCALKGKSEQDCQNYIRVFARIDSKRIMICGTNSYKPRCRTYTNLHSLDDRTFEESEALGRCAYNPTHNSTYVFTDGQLYSATVADFSSADPLIYREPQRTEQYDLKQLNQPDFISAMELNGYVFFFFRESAMEYMNCGKAIYSRIARVCKNDKGGPHGFGDRWTSFLKTRLNCSVPGDYPFYFDEIQATSKIIEHLYQNRRNEIIYAVFTTPINAIPGSAVCAFSTDEILEAFSGPFKVQRNSTSIWLPLSVDNLPEPRPGQCVDDSRTLPSSVASFIKTHSLMDTAVPALYGKPLLTRVSLLYRLTAIAVDSQVIAKDGSTYDVIFVGSDDGRVIKFINIVQTSNQNDIETVVISEMQALPNGRPVRELTVASQAESLVVVGDGHIVSIPLHQCSQLLTCRQCVEIRDPFCVWEVRNRQCSSIQSTSAHRTSDYFIQNLTSITDALQACKRYGNDGDNNIENGFSVIQPAHGTVSAIAPRPLNFPMTKDGETIVDEDGNILENTITHHLVNDPNNVQLANSSLNWIIAAAFFMVLFLVIGFIIGRYLTKRSCKNSPFLAEHRNELSSTTRPLHSRTNGKDTNLLMNVGVRNNKNTNYLENEFVVGHKDRSHECKNSTENLEKVAPCKTGTLTKVKSTYI